MLNEHYDVTTAAYAVGYESYPISVGNIRGLYRATEPSVSPRNRLQSFWLVWVSAMASPHLMHLDMLQLPACKQYVRGRLEH